MRRISLELCAMGSAGEGAHNVSEWRQHDEQRSAGLQPWHTRP